MTGLGTGGEGQFVSANVDPGHYTSTKHAGGCKDAQCTVVVAAASAAPAMGPSGPAPGAPTPPGWMPPAGLPGTATPPVPTSGPTFTDVDCPLEANPRTGSVSGTALDADTNAPVSGVSIKVVDTQGKELGIAADGNGGFHMENLQPGTISIKAEADGYMLHVQSVDVRAREDSRAELKLRKRPKKGDVQMAAYEIKIKKQ